MTTYYKATRPDGTDFHSGTVDYAAAIGGTVDIGRAARRRPPAICTGTVLHASDIPEATLIGGSWPCRLFEVTGRPVADDGARKHGFRRVRVLREVESWLALGPQGREVAALIDRARHLTPDETAGLAAAWDAARDAAWDTARVAAGAAAWDAAVDAAWVAARAAAGLVSRDLIGKVGLTQAHYDTLTSPWRTVIGPIHPEDAPL